MNGDNTVKTLLKPTMRSSQTTTQARFIKKYGSWAIVTGASDGIGREFAMRLAEVGLNLVLVARREKRLSDLAKSLEKSCGISCMVIALDLSATHACAQLIDETKTLDVGLVIASAGFGSSGAFIASDINQEIEMLNLNCRALMELSHHFGQRFAGQKRGGLILMSSLVAFQGVPGAAHYAATKAYVQSLAEALHEELRPLGVDVLASAPGPVQSGFGYRANMRIGNTLLPADIAQSTLNALGRTNLIRPGWLSKVLELSLKTLPRWGRVKMLAIVMGGMIITPQVKSSRK